MRKLMLRMLATTLTVLLMSPLLHEVIPHGHEVAHAQGYPYCTAEQHDASRWHLPYNVDVPGGCLYGHEHGDAPPQWIADAGYEAGFDHDGGFHGNTSHKENTEKHAAMKGFLADYTDYSGGAQQAYVRVHIASNVLDRTAQYHSTEVFLRDSTGAVSHWQLWLNTGSPETNRFLYDGRNDPGHRPILLTQDETTFPVVKNEHWYTSPTAGWGWNINWTIDVTTFWRHGETYDTDVSHWLPTGRLGTVRRMEPAWYGPDSHVHKYRGNPPVGVEFWSTAMGEIVSGPDAPQCLPTVAQPQPVPCLSQYIAPTAKSIEQAIPGGTPRERVFPGIGLGVRLPN
jgi:hypothetical protein